MPWHRGMDGTLRFSLVREAALGLALAACAGGTTDPVPVAARLAHPATTFNQLRSLNATTSTTLFESFAVLAPRFTPASAAPFAPAQSLVLAQSPLELAARNCP